MGEASTIRLEELLKSFRRLMNADAKQPFHESRWVVRHLAEYVFVRVVAVGPLIAIALIMAYVFDQPTSSTVAACIVACPATIYSALKLHKALLKRFMNRLLPYAFEDEPGFANIFLAASRHEFQGDTFPDNLSPHFARVALDVARGLVLEKGTERETFDRGARLFAQRYPGTLNGPHVG